MDLTPEQNKISEELLLELRRAEIGCTGDANGRHTLGECCERAGLAEVIPKIRESAYQAGREDAARAVEEFGERLVCHECGPDIAGFAAAARSTNLGRSAGGVGDNPEEQRP